MSADAGTLPPVIGFGPFLRKLDLRVLLPAAALVAMGLAAIAADKPGVLAAQVRWAAVGFVVMLGMVYVPYRRVLDLAYPLYGLSIILLLLVLIPGVGVQRNGGWRWLYLGGVSFQPSELAKVAHVLALARYIRFRKDQKTLKGLLIPFVMTVVPMALILKEPDLGTALMLVPVLFALLWIAGARTKHLATVVLFGALSMPALYPFLAPHQKERMRTYVEPVVAFLAPSEDAKPTATPTETATETKTATETETATKTAPAPKPANTKRERPQRKVDTYQRDNAMSAVAGGGLLGQPWGEGRANQLDAVPFSWTDFVFTVHAEEWGFLGVLLLLGAEAALLLGLATVAKELREPAGRLLAVGALVIFGTQAAVNLSMTVGLAPITGLPLPFLSYGGTAMVTSWMLLGLALNARANRPLSFTEQVFE